MCSLLSSGLDRRMGLRSFSTARVIQDGLSTGDHHSLKQPWKWEGLLSVKIKDFSGVDSNKQRSYAIANLHAHTRTPY